MPSNIILIGLPIPIIIIIIIIIHDITMSNKVRSAVVNKPVGVEFNVIKVVCILFFHI